MLRVEANLKLRLWILSNSLSKGKLRKALLRYTVPTGALGKSQRGLSLVGHNVASEPLSHKLRAESSANQMKASVDFEELEWRKSPTQCGG